MELNDFQFVRIGEGSQSPCDTDCAAERRAITEESHTRAVGLGGYAQHVVSIDDAAHVDVERHYLDISFGNSGAKLLG